LRPLHAALRTREKYFPLIDVLHYPAGVTQDQWPGSTRLRGSGLYQEASMPHEE
jgi:hypothetical protein